LSEAAGWRLARVRDLDPAAILCVPTERGTFRWY
jgi:hypothetical protein